MICLKPSFQFPKQYCCMFLQDFMAIPVISRNLRNLYRCMWPTSYIQFMMQASVKVSRKVHLIVAYQDTIAINDRAMRQTSEGILWKLQGMLEAWFVWSLVVLVMYLLPGVVWSHRLFMIDCCC